MAQTRRLLKAAAIWIAVVYVVCYAGVALVPAIRPAFARWALHMETDFGSTVLTLGTFVVGLAIWEVLGLLALALFAGLYNRVR